MLGPVPVTIALWPRDLGPGLAQGQGLAGFTDSEGCFTVSVVKRSETYNQVFVRYILSQKGELELMTKIAEMLNGKVSYLKSYEGYNMIVNLSKLH